MNEFTARGLVDYPDIRVRDLAEVLAAFISVIDSYGESNLVDARRKFLEVNADNFIVSFSCAGEVVSCVLDRSR